MARTWSIVVIGAVLATASAQASGASVEDDAAAALAVEVKPPKRAPEPTAADHAERRCKEDGEAAALARFRDAWKASGEVTILRRMGDCAARWRDWGRAHKLYGLYLKRAPMARDYERIAGRFVTLDEYLARTAGGGS